MLIRIGEQSIYFVLISVQWSCLLQLQREIKLKKKIIRKYKNKKRNNNLQKIYNKRKKENEI